MTDSALRTGPPGSAALPDPAGPGLLAGLWRRQLPHYPANARRAFYLGVVVIVTITLYYELYVQGTVATQITAQYHMTLAFFIGIGVVANALGALSSVAAGLADRWGRCNLVVTGLLITGLLITFGLPNAPNRNAFAAMAVLVSIVEGMVLVATPALIRDFSPQLGRASAMGFWTLGPVIGSLVASEVSSHTQVSHPDWQFQYVLAGITGLVVFVVALLGLRELSPQLRDQLMVSLRDRTLIEAKAAGIDPEKALQGHWKQMLKPDVLGSSFAISVFLLFYYFAVGFFVIYYATVFGYTPQQANSLANWYWIANAIALLVIGVVSDWLKVRKPFMVIGGLISATGVAWFAILSTHVGTSYHQFAWLLVLIAAGGGIAYCAWMAAYTETVERHNPAGTATGLAIWGGVLRIVVSASLIVVPFVVPVANILVDHGTEVQALSQKYAPQLATLNGLSPTTQGRLSSDPNNPIVQSVAISELSGVNADDVGAVLDTNANHAAELATLQAISPANQQALAANKNDPVALSGAIGDIATKFGISPTDAGNRLLATAAIPPHTLALLADTATIGKIQAAGAKLQDVGKIPAADLATLSQYGPQVLQAQKDAPGQWQRWWWVAFGGQLLFLPFVFVMVGRWRPKRARQDARDHEAAVDRELAALAAGEPQTA